MLHIPKIYNNPNYLNLAYLWPITEVDGPGKRTAIWVQGCLKRCKGCITPEMQPIQKKMWIEVSQLFQFICSIDGIEGVTVFGGEPALQFMALSQLFEMLKKAGLTTMLYTGYYYEELLKCGHPLKKKLLRYTDILVDGPYIESLDHGEMWRGSSNQRILFLSDVYCSWKWVLNEKRRDIVVRMGRDGSFIILGIPPKNFNKVLNKIQLFKLK